MTYRKYAEIPSTEITHHTPNIAARQIYAMGDRRTKYGNSLADKQTNRQTDRQTAMPTE